MSLPNPIVLLDARAKYVHPAFQMTRASTKTVFDSTGRLVTVPPNAIGWDHDPATGQARGYLAEPSATNLLLHSNDLSDGAWGKTRSAVTPDAIVGPDGKGVAKVSETADAGAHYVQQTWSGASGSEEIVFSVIGKAAERTRILLRLLDGSGGSARAEVDLAAGQATLGSVAGFLPLGVGVEPLANGFCRAWLAVVLQESSTALINRVDLLDAQGDGDYTGDGSSGIYLGYAQTEEGRYPTSYIETGAATATRAGDSLVLSDLGDFTWFAANEGTFVWEYELGNLIPFGEMITILGTTFAVRQSASGTSTVLTGNSVNAITFVPSEDTAIGKKIRAALSYDRDDYSASYNGLLYRQGDVTDTIPANGTLRLGHENHIRISRAVYYPQRISNADLQSLTALQE